MSSLDIFFLIVSLANTAWICLLVASRANTWEMLELHWKRAQAATKTSEEIFKLACSIDESLTKLEDRVAKLESNPKNVTE